MNKRYYEHTLPIIRGSLSNTYVLAVILPKIAGKKYLSGQSEKLKHSEHSLEESEIFPLTPSFQTDPKFLCKKNKNPLQILCRGPL